MGAGAAGACMAAMAAARSGAANTAVPATSTVAPAWTTSGAVSGVMPPSTSSAMGRSPIMRRTCAILGSWSCRKACPPKPGLTVITRIRSATSSTAATASAGVPGFRATPARLPRERMSCRERCRCGPASAWTMMWSAPASAKAAM